MRTIHQQKVDKFMILAGQNVPTRPMIPNKETRELRASLILEESLETIKALGFDVYVLGPEDCNLKLSMGNAEFNSNYEPNMIEVADGCADIKVVTTGTLTAFGIDDNELQDAVDENNLAKFGPGGHRREDGKWMKPPDHQPPNIEKVLNEQKDCC